MTTRRRVVAGLAFSILMLPARGLSAADATADPAAEEFLGRIYAHYTGRDGTDGLPLDNPALVREFFDPPLAALILADQANSAKRDEPTALDGDPFVDAQDWLITGLRIKVTPIDAQRADASVTFRNFEKPRQIQVNLIRLAAGWRIHEITYSQLTLTDILTAPN